MDRNYNNLKWYSKEREEHYKEVNQSKQKKMGEQGEELAKSYLKSHGYDVRDSSSKDDAFRHADLYFCFPSEDRWHSMDVKYKSGFPLELVNYWGAKGWLFAGAEYILNIDQRTGSMYLFRREDMEKYYHFHKPIFDEKYCNKVAGRSMIWYASQKRIEEWKKLGVVKELK